MRVQNANSIEDIFARNMKTVFKVCYSYFGNIPDAEDATQQVFMKLLDKPRVFSSVDHERAWLIVCAQNLCKDVLKSAAYSKRAEMPQDIEDEGAQEQRIEGNFTLDAVLALPEQYRNCIYLYYYEGYSTAEIATLLGSPASTVRNWMADGRALLKKSLGGE